MLPVQLVNPWDVVDGYGACRGRVNAHCMLHMRREINPHLAVSMYSTHGLPVL